MSERPQENESKSKKDYTRKIEKFLNDRYPTAKEQSTLKDCSSCLMYQYHSYLLPEKIITERQKHWDEILTNACNSCDENSFWHDADKYQLNDLFVQELDLKLKKLRLSAQTETSKRK